MADRTSAEIFGNIFPALAAVMTPGPERDKLADLFWALSRNYDFCDGQMECDEALAELGLARRGPCPRYPEETITIYGRMLPTSSEVKGG